MEKIQPSIGIYNESTRNTHIQTSAQQPLKLRAAKQKAVALYFLEK